MGSRIVSGLKIALVCLPLAAQSASATGNLDCSIDDKQLNFEFSALTGGAGGIVQINQASVEIKVGDDKALRSKRAIELKNIEQQWIYGNELRGPAGNSGRQGRKPRQSHSDRDLQGRR